LDRNTLWAAQTPQCYQRAILEKALEKYGSEKDATDESQLVEKLGVKVQLVLSDYRNTKLTTPEDLAFARALVEEKFIYRTGFGFDIHRMQFGLKMYIGGAEMIYPKGFVGHSDGDLVLHAICDAVLGALCAGEIGLYFPPSDPEIKGIRSTDIVKKVLEVVKNYKATIEHIDATLIIQAPKISPHYEQIRQSLADVFEIPAERISFKSKSHEGIGEIGRGEAAMCQAVATLKIKE
jgi:2-C-methyl-D-erythritol 4-phosphate cytidylyltransferase/2-C-methyl-D-erythritol 2,4-cyclodiphosphate synthase